MTHHRDKVHVSSAAPAPEQRSPDSAGSEDENLNRMLQVANGQSTKPGCRKEGTDCVLGREAKRCRKLVVELVDVLVQRLVVEEPVCAVVPCVFHDKEESDLGGHGGEAGEGHLPRLHADGCGHGVEKVDLVGRAAGSDGVS